MDAYWFRWALGVPEVSEIFDKANEAFDKHIPNCDPRIKEYYFSKVENFEPHFTEEATFNERVAVMTGYTLALIRFCKDLNESAMEAKFDEIMGKLNEK